MAADLGTVLQNPELSAAVSGTGVELIWSFDSLDFGCDVFWEPKAHDCHCQGRPDRRRVYFRLETTNF